MFHSYVSLPEGNGIFSASNLDNGWNYIQYIDVLTACNKIGETNVDVSSIYIMDIFRYNGDNSNGV